MEQEIIGMKRDDFAKRWSMSLRALDHLVEDGIVPVVKLGKRFVRVPIKEADAAIMKHLTTNQ